MTKTWQQSENYKLFGGKHFKLPIVRKRTSFRGGLRLLLAIIILAVLFIGFASHPTVVVVANPKANNVPGFKTTIKYTVCDQESRTAYIYLESPLPTQHWQCQFEQGDEVEAEPHIVLTKQLFVISCPMVLDGPTQTTFQLKGHSITLPLTCNEVSERSRQSPKRDGIAICGGAESAKLVNSEWFWWHERMGVTNFVLIVNELPHHRVNDPAVHYIMSDLSPGDELLMMMCLKHSLTRFRYMLFLTPFKDYVYAEHFLTLPEYFTKNPGSGQLPCNEMAILDNRSKAEKHLLKQRNTVGRSLFSYNCELGPVTCERNNFVMDFQDKKMDMIKTKELVVYNLINSTMTHCDRNHYGIKNRVWLLNTLPPTLQLVMNYNPGKARTGNYLYFAVFWHLIAQHFDRVLIDPYRGLAFERNHLDTIFYLVNGTLPQSKRTEFNKNYWLSQYQYPLSSEFYCPNREFISKNILVVKTPTQKKFDVLVHVRMEDIMNEHPAYTLLPLSFFVEVFDNLMKEKIVRIAIVSRAIDDDQIKMLQDLTTLLQRKVLGSQITTYTNNSIAEDFQLILDSDIVVGSTSTFWFWPSFLSATTTTTKVPKEIHLPIFQLTSVEMFPEYKNKEECENYSVFFYKLPFTKKALKKDYLKKYYDVDPKLYKL